MPAQTGDKKKKTGWWSNLKALLIGIFLSLVLIEVLLRIFHPFHFRISNGSFSLPANQKIVRHFEGKEKLEPVVHYSRNSIGLRGADWPSDPEKYLKIITIGGSTTECSYISDSLTWPEQLRALLQNQVARPLWLNNAGLDGTSTFGHLILLSDQIVQRKPDYILFLVGVNDMENKGPGSFDLYHSNSFDKQDWKGWLRTLALKTETGALIENIYRYRLAYNKGLVHKVIDYKSLRNLVPDSVLIARKMAAQADFLQQYRRRLLTLDSICAANHIQAIFLTQPSLFASFKDPSTGLDFAGLEAVSNRSCLEMGRILNQYNEVLLTLGAEQKLQVINTAAAMPLDSRYYIDFTHYTVSGADTLARIIADSLRRYLPLQP